MANVVAIDYGSAKIGIAIGDTELKHAFTRSPILLQSEEAIWPALTALIAAEQPATLVVGLPLNADGSDSDQTTLVRKFVQVANQRLSIPIVLWDERYTTQAVQREQKLRTLPRGMEDSLAAQLILEGYLASLP